MIVREEGEVVLVERALKGSWREVRLSSTSSLNPDSTSDRKGTMAQSFGVRQVHSKESNNRHKVAGHFAFL